MYVATSNDGRIAPESATLAGAVVNLAKVIELPAGLLYTRRHVVRHQYVDKWDVISTGAGKVGIVEVKPLLSRRKCKWTFVSGHPALSICPKCGRPGDAHERQHADVVPSMTVPGLDWTAPVTWLVLSNRCPNRRDRQGPTGMNVLLVRVLSSENP